MPRLMHLLLLVTGLWLDTAMALNPVQVAWLNGAAANLAKAGPHYYRNNLEQLLNRIDCSQIDCSPRAVCQYLNLGAFLPRSCMDESPEQITIVQSQEDKMFEIILGLIPRPPVCLSTIAPQRPIVVGTVAIDLFPAVVDLAAIEKCRQELDDRRQSLQAERSEVLKYFEKIELGFFRIRDEPAVYWSNGDNAYCHVPAPSLIADTVRRYDMDILKTSWFAFHGGCRYRIELGFFAVLGDGGIFFSNGENAYCWVPHPKYVTQEVRVYDYNIHNHTTFRRDGQCPGMD